MPNRSLIQKPLRRPFSFALDWKQTKYDSVLPRYVCQSADNHSSIWQSYEPNAAGKTFGATFAQQLHFCFLAEKPPATADRRRLDGVK